MPDDGFFPAQAKYIMTFPKRRNESLSRILRAGSHLAQTSFDPLNDVLSPESGSVASSAGRSISARLVFSKHISC